MSANPIIWNDQRIEAPPASDMVNHPLHYTSHPSGIECITITEHMAHNLASAVEYIWRAPTKGKFEEDIRKAIWYLHRELQRVCNIPHPGKL